MKAATVILPGSKGYRWEHGGESGLFQPVAAFLLKGKAASLTCLVRSRKLTLAT